MIKRFITYVFFILCAGTAIAQQQTYENLVPNPGFEKFSGPVIGWFYKGSHFSTVMKYWSSPTGASPDIFGSKVRVPKKWSDKGFGKCSPHSGQHMVGITSYGCKNGKPHCREYIQIQLSEPLVVNQSYYVEFWVSHLPRSLYCNNIGAYFSEIFYDYKTEEFLDFTPSIKAEEAIEIPPNTWKKISGSFIAKKEASNLILGNFSEDDQTITKGEKDLNFSYYYIDDVVVRKQEPILDVPIKKDDLIAIDIQEGATITLKNIFFDLDKAELLPRSYKELYKLLKLLRVNPNMVIEIRGHTDNQGEAEYNMHLSFERAKAVVEYLKKGGINDQRTTFRGFGDTQPIAENTTLEGRQMNRRVEFYVIKK